MTSESLRLIGYDALRKLLILQFTSGESYAYAGVPEARYRGLMRAASKGAYVTRHIRKAYRFRKLKEAEMAQLQGAARREAP